MSETTELWKSDRMRSRWTGRIVGGLALILLGGVALIVRAGNRDEERRVVAQARSDYRFKLQLKAIHEDGEARLAAIRGRQRTKLTEKDKKYYGEAIDAETAFMESCRKCAPAAECERDRLVIASGRSTDSYNPCD